MSTITPSTRKKFDDWRLESESSGEAEQPAVREAVPQGGTVLPEAAGGAVPELQLAQAAPAASAVAHRAAEALAPAEALEKLPRKSPAKTKASKKPAKPRSQDHPYGVTADGQMVAAAETPAQRMARLEADPEIMAYVRQRRQDDAEQSVLAHQHADDRRRIDKSLVEMGVTRSRTFTSTPA